MKTLPFILIVSAFLGLPAAPSTAVPLLNDETVVEIFSSRDNEEGRPFSPAAVTIVQGSFTAADRTEAVVSFLDTGQSHGRGAAEIWLLRPTEDAWQPILKITESDTAEFLTTDINADGIFEILTHTTGQNRGCVIIDRQLLYFADGRPTKLLTFEGFDNTGWPEKGICAFDARFAFKDVNRDKILEVELTEFFDYCRKEGDVSIFERRSEKTTLFRPVLSPSGSIIGIERLK